VLPSQIFIGGLLGIAHGCVGTTYHFRATKLVAEG
jgi:hypothetical protein